MHRGITFQIYATNNIMKKVINKTTSDDGLNQSNQNPVVTIWFRLPYCGDKSVQLANSCVKNFIASKTLTLNLSFFMTLRSLSFSVIAKIKHPFQIIRT